MPFPQDQVAWLLANHSRIARYMFIPQLVAAFLFLGFAYVTGKVHAHLLITGARTQGKIIALVPVRVQDRTRSGTTSITTIYEPVIEFAAGDHVLRFQEWKGSRSNAGLGSAVPVLYDPANPSLAMMDRGPANWLPWAPCFAIGLILALAALRGILTLGRAPDAVALPSRA
jgi:hypothetical protein